MSLFKKKSQENQLELAVYNMTCGHCEMRVKKALEGVEGVKAAKADHTKDRAVVTIEKGKDVRVDTLIEALEPTGYRGEAL